MHSKPMSMSHLCELFGVTRLRWNQLINAVWTFYWTLINLIWSIQNVNAFFDAKQVFLAFAQWSRKLVRAWQALYWCVFCIVSWCIIVSQFCRHYMLFNTLNSSLVILSVHVSHNLYKLHRSRCCDVLCCDWLWHLQFEMHRWFSLAMTFGQWQFIEEWMFYYALNTRN